MGFYGNITNTSKTTFQFDKIYPSRVEMDKMRSIDGIYPGRYVLIEYDETPHNLIFQSDELLNPNTPVWMCGGQAYTGTFPTIVTQKGNVIFNYLRYLVPLEGDTKSLIMPDNEHVKVGSVVRVLPGHRINNINTQLMFIKVKDYSEDGGYNFESVFFPDYCEYVDSIIEEKVLSLPVDQQTQKRAELMQHSYKPAEFSKESPYESGKYYKWVPPVPELNLQGHYAISPDPQPEKDVKYFEKIVPPELQPDRIDPKNLYLVTETTYGANEEIFEYNSKKDFPPAGKIGVLYWAKDTDITYRWKEDKYVEAPLSRTIRRKFYDSKETEENLNPPVTPGEIYQILVGHKYDINGCLGESEAYEFWTVVSTDENVCKWSSLKTAADAYLINANRDKIAYKNSRGYDSTVWQKIIQDGRDQYVMIAELNSVVPTFDITSDAPTLLPRIPHFDKNTTNVYYKLHTQPQWGLRLKAANGEFLGPVFDKNGEEIPDSYEFLSRDNRILPSDESIYWEDSFYNKKTGKTEVKGYDPWKKTWGENPMMMDGAIFYNKKGFDSHYISKGFDVYTKGASPDNNQYYEKNSRWDGMDRISITPTGQSGQTYNNHDGNIVGKVQPDVQELSIMLPSIGDAVSGLWDLIYGGRQTSKAIEISNYRNQDISWEDGKDFLRRKGLRFIQKNGYDEKQVETLAGCINSIHDLMGMIIIPYYALDFIELCEEEVQKRNQKNYNSQTGFARLSNNKIYYIHTLEGNSFPNSISQEAKKLYKKYEGNFVYKHLTYDFVKASEALFTYEQVDSTKIDINAADAYYILSNGIYKKASRKNFLNKDTIYQKKIANPYSSIALQDWNEKDGKEYYYIDTEKNVSSLSPTQIIAEKYNYIKRDIYFDNKSYLKLTSKPVPLRGSYEPDAFFYSKVDPSTQVNDGYYLDSNEQPDENKRYYTIDNSKVFNITEDVTLPYEEEGPNGEIIKKDLTRKSYQGFYIPGTYYYKNEKTNSYEIYLGDSIIQGNAEIKLYIRKEIPGGGSSGDQYDESTEYKEVKLTKEEFEFRRGVLELYYKDDLDQHILVTKTDAFDADQTYYYKYIILKPSDDKRYEFCGPYYFIDTPDYSIPSDCFYTKVFDPEHKEKVIGYKPFTYQDIKKVYFDENGELVNQKDVVVFGYNHKAVSGQSHFANVNSEIDAHYALKEQDSFYNKGVYYYNDTYKDGDTTLSPAYNSFILDTSDHATKERQYYLITSLKINNDIHKNKYYQPNKYYYKNDKNEFVLDKTRVITPGRVYYLRSPLYVCDDAKGVYNIGTEWTNETMLIPSGVTLGERKETYDLQPLNHFGRSLNTIHGLILKINQILASDDQLTRDDSTVQGAINQLKDILVRFDDLAPRKIMGIDSHGTITTFDLDTDQKNSYNQKKTTSTLDPFGDIQAENSKSWISASVDSDPNHPKLILHHSFNKGVDDTQTFDYNTGGKIQDTLNISLPHEDEMGHIIKRTDMTWTLPYGFKTIDIKNDGSVTEPASQIGSFKAKNTQDTLKISSSNKWIKLDSKNDTLSIGHITSIKGKLADYQNEQDKEDDITYNLSSKKPIINFSDFITDEAGHCVGYKKITFQIPNVFNTIKTSNSTTDAIVQSGTNNDLVADSLSDNFEISTGNKWLNISLNDENNKFIISHMGPGKQTGTTQTGAETPAFGSTFIIPEVKYDATGHVCGIGTHTVTIPKGSLEDQADGNVMTNLTLVPESGKITITKTKLANLLLNGYTEQTDIKDSITEADSLNIALNKLQNRLTKQENDLNNEVTTNRNTAISDAISTEVTNRNQKIVDSIAELEFTFTDADNISDPYISNISQSKGIVTANRASLKESVGKLSYSYDDITNITIENLVKKVHELEQLLQTQQPTV